MNVKHLFDIMAASFFIFRLQLSRAGLQRLTRVAWSNRNPLENYLGQSRLSRNLPKLVEPQKKPFETCQRPTWLVQTLQGFAWTYRNSLWTYLSPQKLDKEQLQPSQTRCKPSLAQRSALENIWLIATYLSPALATGDLPGLQWSILTKSPTRVFNRSRVAHTGDKENRAKI